MPLVHFFETSFGRTYERHMVLVEVVSGGRLRLGRSHLPARTPSTTRSGPIPPGCMLQRLRRAARAGPASSPAPATWTPLTAHIRGHYMARGGLEAAVWDLEARLRRHAAVAGRSAAAPARRSPAASPSASRTSVDQLLEKIETELDAGYQRIKMKIKPGWDVDVIREVREAISRRSS